MEETQTDGRVILRQYPTQGQEITMAEGVWKDSKATGKMEGHKLVVDTTMPTGMKWHDEWTLAVDGRTYSALRQMVSAGNGGGFGGGKGPGGGKGAADRKPSPRFHSFSNGPQSAARAGLMLSVSEWELCTAAVRTTEA